MKYWNEEGQYQKEYQELHVQLVPVSGYCETLGGETLRAASRLYYDAYNNGFCNNTSGALIFLRQFLPTAEKIKESLDYIYPKTNTGGYSSTGEMTGVALDSIVDAVVEFNLKDIRADSKGEYEMFDFQEEDEYDEYDEDEY